MKKTKQKTALARQREHGNSLRTWLQDRAIAAGKRRAEARKKAAKQPAPSRGVDRVPARLRVERPAPEVLVQLQPEPRYRKTKTRLRQQRTMRLDHAAGEALKGRTFVTDEGERQAIATVRRWTR